MTDESGEYAAAPLPFALDALEPAIDPRTVEIHYNFHHKPAVTAANNAEAALAKARDNGDFSLVKFYEKELAFQLSSHLLDQPQWKRWRSDRRPCQGNVGRVRFLCQVEGAVVRGNDGCRGTGWGILGYHPMTKKLMVLQCENHQKLTAWGVVPLLVLNVSRTRISQVPETVEASTSAIFITSSTGITLQSDTTPRGRKALR